MFEKKSSFLVVYVDRNRIQFYGASLPAILALDIPSTIAKDLEILNKDGLYTLVNLWLKQNNLGGAQLFFIFSPTTYFEKDLTARGESEQETEILAFYDSVPFEELATIVLTIDAKKIAVATNKDFVASARHAFTLQGFRVVGAIPAVLLGALSAKRWLDPQMGDYVLKHMDGFRGQNIIDLDIAGPSSSTPTPSTVPNEKNNPRLMIMVSILGVLLLVLIFFAFL